jgi:hypothetical protein
VLYPCETRLFHLMEPAALQQLNLPLSCNTIIRGYLTYAEQGRIMLTAVVPNVALGRCMMRIQILHRYAGVELSPEQLLRLQIVALIVDIHECLRQHGLL